jgi:hypothetical protein
MTRCGYTNQAQKKLNHLIRYLDQINAQDMVSSI